MSLGIVVPAFRPDVDALGSYVRELDDRLSPETIRIELDDPAAGAVDALAHLPATVNAVPARRGKGAAVTAGFEALDTDTLAFVDADGATPIESVSAVVDPVLGGDVALAVGSRRHPGSDVTHHQGNLRRLLGDGFAWLARRLVGGFGARLYDYQCGAKALSADVWRVVRDHLREPGFAWDLELLAVAGASGFRIREVPVTWEDKPGSTVAPVRDALSMFAGLVRARHRAGVVAGSRLHRSIARDPGPSLVDRAADPRRQR
ncbi:glycosyltransferase [Halorubrum sp. DTA98]|uniref:glycosyltransferase n=1 Tax=Halorubrum sp. DTA98 TaxID=3402163 RepID=UPI003AAD2F2F